MSSNEDMFDLSDTFDDLPLMDQMPESPSPPTPTPPTPTPPTPTPPTPTPPTPTPPTPTPTPPTQQCQAEFLEAGENHDVIFGSVLKGDCKLANISECSQIRLDFLDSAGNKVSPSRYTDNSEVIKIMKSLIRSENPLFRNSAAGNIANSELLKTDIHNHVLQNVSREFSDFLSLDECPLKDTRLFKNFANLAEIDLDCIVDKCVGLAGNLLKSLGTICFGVENMEEMLAKNTKYEKQRLLAIIAISAITRNRNNNVIQKILGEFLKIKSSNRQVLQLIQRMGLSLVSKTIRSDMDVISTHFMNEVEDRKLRIEQWAMEREMYEKEVKAELTKNAQNFNSQNFGRKLYVKYTQNELIPPIVDLSELEFVNANIVPNTHVIEMIHKHGSAEKALDDHLDNRPADFTVTYDNIDIGVTPNEFIGEVTKDQSLHWCSSMVFEDVVRGNELIDDHAERTENVDFNELVKLTEDERNHLLADYTQLVINIVVNNWPNSFPEMKSKHIAHQYTREFEAGVRSLTGPLVCETESTLEGISCVIKTLVEAVCPSKVDERGLKSPIHPTTFR